MSLRFTILILPARGSCHDRWEWMTNANALRDESPAIGLERARVQSSPNGDAVTRTSRFA